MSMVAFAAAKGAPGVTTAAAAVAAVWPAERGVLLAECDPGGGDLAARFGLPAQPGLVSLAAAARRELDAAMVAQHTQTLPGGLRVLVGPPGAEQAAAALKAAGIPVTSLTAKSAKDAARVGTMHRMKGLEFQAVAVIGVADGVVPAPAAVIPAETDLLAHAQDLQRERCLLFVACTRARDHLYVSYSGSPSPFLARS